MYSSPDSILANQIAENKNLKILEVGGKAFIFGGGRLSLLGNGSQYYGYSSSPEDFSQINEEFKAALRDDIDYNLLCTNNLRSLSNIPFHCDITTINGSFDELFTQELLDSLKPGGYLFLSTETELKDNALKKFDIKSETASLKVLQKKDISNLITCKSFSEVKEGDAVKFKHCFDEKDLAHFTKMSGDINPLHFDDNYAKEIGFEQKLVFGLLSASLVSRLVGVDIPGMYSLIREVKISFPRPLYPNQEVEVSGSIESVDRRNNILSIKYDGRRTEDQQKVFRGKVQVTFAEPKEDDSL
jgi:acyl dehydratase